jgi:hypothetical protein
MGNADREVAAELSGIGSEEPWEEAAPYGLMGTMPDRRMAKTLALKYLNNLC